MDPTWDFPVRVQTTRGDWVAIASPDAVVKFIDAQWPIDQGPLCKRARLICDDILETDSPSKESRRAFIAALIEAHCMYK